MAVPQLQVLSTQDSSRSLKMAANPSVDATWRLLVANDILRAMEAWLRCVRFRRRMNELMQEYSRLRMEFEVRDFLLENPPNSDESETDSEMVVGPGTPQDSNFCHGRPLPPPPSSLSLMCGAGPRPKRRRQGGGSSSNQSRSSPETPDFEMRR